MTREARDEIYRKWESWYPKFGFSKEHCYKWLRDEYASLMNRFVDKGENVVVEGCFRSGKSSLGVYFGKLKELGRLGNVKTVGYIDMVEVDKNNGKENSWSSNFDFKVIEQEARKEVIMLDEMYYPEALEKVAYPLIKKYGGNKSFIILLHPSLKYENNSIDKNFRRLKPRKITLHSYSRSQEDMILGELDARREQVDWLKDNLNGNRVLYNITMHKFFNEKTSLQKVISMFSQGFSYESPYFIQDNIKNRSIVEKASKGKKLSRAEKKRLFDFGISSQRKVCDYDEFSIPSPIINVMREKKIDKALMLD